MSDGNKVYNLLITKGEYDPTEQYEFYKGRINEEEDFLYKEYNTLEHELTDELFEKIDPKLNYVALHNPNWLGVTSSTKALFKNTLAVEELYSKKVINMLADKLENYKVVIFSGMVDGWENLMKELKNRNISF